MPGVGSGLGPGFRYLAVISALAASGPRPPLVELAEEDVWRFHFLLSRLRAPMVRSLAETQPVLASSSATVACLVWGRARPRRDR
jgi:hypothetical protein